MHIVLLQNNEVVAYSRERIDGNGITLKFKDKVNDGDAEFEIKSFSSRPNRSIEPK